MTVPFVLAVVLIGVVLAGMHSAGAPIGALIGLLAVILAGLTVLRRR